uniref:Uncharacterized protein n=1 Tax=Graphocephala atropunctata TaxID=36148 RepID=A0A1B6KN84_9HEMI
MDYLIKYEMLAATAELNAAREKLMESLGEKKKLYVSLMRMWFRHKISKERFDMEVRKMMDSKQAHFHNEFLLNLFFKCVKPDLPEHGTMYSKLRARRRAAQYKIGFHKANHQEYAPERVRQKLHEDRRYPIQDLLVPDEELIHMRMMLSSWELGLEGSNRRVANYIFYAVRIFVKDIIIAVLSLKNGFRVNAKGALHGIGAPVPNPWLKKVGRLYELPPLFSDSLYGMEMMDTGEHVPAIQQSLTEKHQDIALIYSTCREPAPKRRMTPFDFLEALKVYTRTIMSHGINTINIERIITGMSHPSYPEIERDQILADFLKKRPWPRSRV